MKCVLFEAIKRAVKKMKNVKEYPKSVFSDEFVNVPSNNLNYGELKLVHDTTRKATTMKHKTSNHETSKRKINKEEFIKNAIVWSNELTMTDQEYEMYIKSKSLNERMDKCNIRVFK